MYKTRGRARTHGGHFFFLGSSRLGLDSRLSAALAATACGLLLPLPLPLLLAAMLVLLADKGRLLALLLFMT